MEKGSEDERADYSRRSWGRRPSRVRAWQLDIKMLNVAAYVPAPKSAPTRAGGGGGATAERLPPPRDVPTVNSAAEKEPAVAP